MTYKCLQYSGEQTKCRIECKTQVFPIPGTYSLIEEKRVHESVKAPPYWSMSPVWFGVIREVLAREGVELGLETTEHA